MKEDSDHSRITHLEDQISILHEEIRFLKIDLATEIINQNRFEKRILKILEKMVDIDV